MRYIDMGECLSEINKARINRENHANVYVYADKTSVGMSFAYSDAKNDEIALVRVNGICNEEFKDELWKELVSAGEEIAEILNVRLVIDDVRPETIVIWKEDFYDK